MAGKLESLILEFFRAENERDWTKYQNYLSNQVEWTLFTVDGFIVVKGKDDYIRTMKRIYENLDSTFEIISLLSDDERGLVMAELEMDSRRSVDVFEFSGRLISREREYYDGLYWSVEQERRQIISMDIKLENKMLEIVKRIAYMFSPVENWAIDGSTSLVLQGLELRPHDIDILTDEKGAYQIQDILGKFVEIPLRHISNERYDSHFGVASMDGIRIEIMGDLKVFRNGRWSETQNPERLKIKVIKLQGTKVPVVSLESQISTGYLQERLSRSL